MTTASTPPSRHGDFMRAALTLLAFAAFQLALLWLFRWAVPPTNRDLVVFMLGQLSGMALLGFQFYLGTSKSSHERSEQLDRLLPEPPRSHLVVRPSAPSTGPADQRALREAEAKGAAQAADAAGDVAADLDGSKFE